MNTENLTSQTILSVVSKLSLFSALDEDEFEIAAKMLKTLHLNQGEDIFREGDTGEEMFIHFSGTLAAYGTQSDGTKKKIFNVRQGDFFGEMCIIVHEPRSVTITAEEESVTIMLKGADFYKIINEHPVIGSKLLGSISAVQNRWLNNMSKSFSDLIRWGETARKRAISDELTGLYNRRFLEESIKERLGGQVLRTTPMLMMDLDKIHGINDKHGTKGGDLVIIAASEEIRSCLRPGDIPARLSGDEFAILLPDTDIDDAKTIAENIRKSIEAREVEVPESPGAEKTTYIKTRTSIGIAAAPTHAKTLEELEETSDTALRKAKELGRNRVEVYA